MKRHTESVNQTFSSPLARIVTVDVSGQPDVVPVAFEYDATYIWVGGSGLSVTRTRKFQT